MLRRWPRWWEPRRLWAELATQVRAGGNVRVGGMVVGVQRSFALGGGECGPGCNPCLTWAKPTAASQVFSSFGLLRVKTLSFWI